MHEYMKKCIQIRNTQRLKKKMDLSQHACWKCLMNLMKCNENDPLGTVLFMSNLVGKKQLIWQWQYFNVFFEIYIFSYHFLLL